jgi:hypothetical protein
MSLASDELDLLSLLNEEKIQETPIMSYFTLAIFSWSLLQFSLNLVVTRGRTFQSIVNDGAQNDAEYDFYNEDAEDAATAANATNKTKTFVEKMSKFILNGGKASSIVTDLDETDNKEKKEAPKKKVVPKDETGDCDCGVIQYIRSLINKVDTEIW